MNRKQQRAAEKLAVDGRAKERRSLVLKVFQEVDEVVVVQLATLAEKGTPPTCSKGCSHCCRQEIRLPRAEAEAIAQWLETTAPDMIDDLRVKLRAWLDWYRSQYPKLITKGIDRGDAFYSHGPQCPALVSDACSIYPVRPIVCRTHYVASPPDACRSDNDPRYLNVPTQSLVADIGVKTAPLATKIRALVQKQGADFKGTVHLLPEWLAHLLDVEEQPWRTSPPLDLTYFD